MSSEEQSGSRHKVTKHTKAKIIMASINLGFYLLFAYFCALACAQNAGDTLVLVDNLAIRETHSIFFKGLQGKKCRSFSCLYISQRLTCQLV